MNALNVDIKFYNMRLKDYRLCKLKENIDLIEL